MRLSRDSEKMWWCFVQSRKLFRRGCSIVFTWIYWKLFGFDTHPDGIYMKLYHKKKIISCTRIVCIERVRWGWGRSGKCACHVTQRKCDGVLFSENCSEGMVSSISSGFIKSYLALIPIRTAFISSYIMKIGPILNAYCTWHRHGIGWGWGRSGKCACHVT